MRKEGLRITGKVNKEHERLDLVHLILISLFMQSADSKVGLWATSGSCLVNFVSLLNIQLFIIYDWIKHSTNSTFNFPQQRLYRDMGHYVHDPETSLKKRAFMYCRLRRV